MLIIVHTTILMENRVCKVTCQASVLESLPGCCDFVYHPYCGVCPVISYASDNSIYTRESNVYRCKIYKGILDILFEILLEEPGAEDILKSVDFKGESMEKEKRNF